MRGAFASSVGVWRRASGGSQPLPENTVAPTISGSVPSGSTLSVDEGTWSDADSFTYQWTRDGVGIFGETFASYTTVIADEGHLIRCEVVGVNGSGSSDPVASSNSITPTDQFFSNVELLIGETGTDGNANMVDESGDTRTITWNGTAQVDTAQKKFGTRSLLLDGNSDYIVLGNDNVFRASSAGDLCIEAWIRTVSLTNQQNIATRMDNDGSEEWEFKIQTNGSLKFNVNAGSPTNLTSASSAIAINTWYHVAATRDGTTWRLFIGGDEKHEITGAALATANSTGMKIGFDPSSGARYFNGWIDEFRFTRGAFRYNASFTPHDLAWSRS